MSVVEKIAYRVGLMPLQNRVDPFGQIHAVPARGLFTGNRGVIHDPATRTLLGRRWTTKAWIVCECEFRGRRRQVMGRNTPSGGAGWTELFFLDEVTALAAGHRPCFYCRRESAVDFLRRFGQAFCIAAPRAPQLDARLHAERTASGGPLTPVSRDDIRALPDGAMIGVGARCFARRGAGLREWHFDRYGRPVDTGEPLLDGALLLTPPTTLAVLAAGYAPRWHGSAFATDRHPKSRAPLRP